MPSTNLAHRRRWRRFLVALPAAVLLTCAWRKPAFLHPSPSADATHDHHGGLHRRDALVGGGVVSAISLSEPAVAEAPGAGSDPAWQLRLPKTWGTLSTADIPADGRPVAVAVAGDLQAETSVSVVRVPLSIVDGDSAAMAKKKVIDFFKPKGAGTEPVTLQEVSNILSDSFQDEAGNIVMFQVVAAPTETTQAGKKYFNYQYQSIQCYGGLRQGGNGMVYCEDPTLRKELPFIDRTHAIKATVVTGGQPDKDVLWLVDLSGPSVDWKNLTQVVTDVLSSFEVGDAALLEKERNVYFNSSNLGDVATKKL